MLLLASCKCNYIHFTTLRDVAKHLKTYSFLFQARIGSIADRQATTAKNFILTQFKMEKIVYCQDKIYADDLKAARAESINKNTKIKDLGPAIASSQGSSFVLEMVSHTKAYFTVSLQTARQYTNALWLASPMGTRARGMKGPLLTWLGGEESKGKSP